MKPTTIAERLALAAMKIAQVNHYMVGFNAVEIDGISFDDYSDAHQILVDRELRLLDKGSKSRIIDLAFRVLSDACYRQHHVNLGR